MSGAESTSSLTTFRSPASARPRRSTIGLTIRHGPHHAAQKSTSTGIAASIAASKLLESAFTIHGSTVWQTLQRGTPDAATGTRLRVRQLVQAMIATSAIPSPSAAGRALLELGLLAALVRAG